MSPNVRGLFRELYVVLPFNPLKAALSKELYVSPSQLYPSSWAIMKSFEIWSEYKNSVATLQLFCICSTFLDGLCCLERKVVDWSSSAKVGCSSSFMGSPWVSLWIGISWSIHWVALPTKVFVTLLSLVTTLWKIW